VFTYYGPTAEKQNTNKRRTIDQTVGLQFPNCQNPAIKEISHSVTVSFTPGQTDSHTSLDVTSSRVQRTVSTAENVDIATEFKCSSSYET